MNKLFKQIKNKIKKSNNVALFTHLNPDFDALGSTYALLYALRNQGKKVQLFVTDELTYKQKLLFDEKEICKETISNLNFDLVITTDTPSINRLGDFGDFVKNFNEENKIIIDHHQNIDLKGSFNFINTDFSSSCEMIFIILKYCNFKITKEIASFLYTGLSSDTNSFVNTNTNSFSFYVAQNLSEYGANLSYINEKLYRTKTRKGIAFKKYLLSNYKEEDDIAYCLINKQQLEILNGDKNDCSGFSSELISFENINISFSIVESKEGYFEISFRSKAGHDVRKIANTLGGGGHICASGAKIFNNDIDNVKEMVLKAIKDNR